MSRINHGKSHPLGQRELDYSFTKYVRSRLKLRSNHSNRARVPWTKCTDVCVYIYLYIKNRCMYVCIYCTWRVFVLTCVSCMSMRLYMCVRTLYMNPVMFCEYNYDTYYYYHYEQTLSSWLMKYHSTRAWKTWNEIGVSGTNMTTTSCTRLVSANTTQYPVQ